MRNIRKRFTDFRSFVTSLIILPVVEKSFICTETSILNLDTIYTEN